MIAWQLIPIEDLLVMSERKTSLIVFSKNRYMAYVVSLPIGEPYNTVNVGSDQN